MSHIVEKIIYSKFDLPVFMEQYLGVRLQRLSEGKYKCLCPFPFHKDNVPSFSIDFKNGGWVWYCYGCSFGGNAVHFFQRYYSLDYQEAIERVCQVGDIKQDLDSYLSAMSSTFDADKERRGIEFDHIDLCVFCKNFLRNFPGDKDAIKTVKETYDKANKILETMNGDKMKELLEEVKNFAS